MRSNSTPAARWVRRAWTMAPAVAPGSHSRPSVSSSTARSTPMAMASRSCSRAGSGPSVSTAVDPPCASISRTAASTAHSSCGLTVKPRKRVSISCWSAVSEILPPVTGTRFTQTRMFIRSASALHAGVLRIEQGRAPHYGDRHWIAIPEVLHRQGSPELGLFGRQIGEQDVLPDGGARARARHVRSPALSVLERGAVRRQDGLAPQHVALHSGRRHVVVDDERAQQRGGGPVALLQVGL